MNCHTRILEHINANDHTFYAFTRGVFESTIIISSSEALNVIKEFKYETQIGFQDKFDPAITGNIITEDNRATSVKTRLISEYKNTHLLRYDTETTRDITEETVTSIVSYVESIEQIDDILLIDYKKGVITKDLATRIIDIANKRNIPVYVDTKKDDLQIFRGCTVIKPNKFEFEKIKLR